MIEQNVKVVIEHDLSMEDINTRIKQEICYETLEELTDINIVIQLKMK